MSVNLGSNVADPRAWAHRIVARYEAGERVNPAAFVMATAAMAGKASALVAA